MGKRVILATFGSFGDLNPYLAIAFELKKRGHNPFLATSAFYRAAIEEYGIGFHPVRPDVTPGDKGMLSRLIDPRRGTEFLLRNMLFPHVQKSYEDLSRAVKGADLLVTHPIVYAGPLVAEKTGIPWASSVLAPMSFFSPFDLPAFSSPRFLYPLRKLGPGVGRVITGLAKRIVSYWSKPIYRLRADLGLSRGKNPVFEGQHSPQLVLALFSPLFGTAMPDWPPNTVITGFPFFDRFFGESELPEELRIFLDAGSRPVLFSLGSSGVLVAGDFYQKSREAMRRLDRRAVFLVGNESSEFASLQSSTDLSVCAHAPYARIFPRCCALVVSGGIGTIAQALRSASPVLVMPLAHDQFDNAARLKRLGMGTVLYRESYTPRRAARLLEDLLGNPAYTAAAARVAEQIGMEQGVASACDALEKL